MSQPNSTIINFDKAHGPFPDHADMVVKTDFGSHKIRVDKQGNIITDELNISFRKLDIGKGKFTI